MVRLQLSIEARLENVTSLEPAFTDFEYFFKVQCNNCHEIHPKFVSLNRKDEHNISNSKGTANFVWRCGFCKRESSAKFESTSTLPYTAENGESQPILIIDCRGLEFVGFDPKGQWKCKGTESGTTFPEVEFKDGETEWVDYDEKAGEPVGVFDLLSKWSRA